MSAYKDKEHDTWYIKCRYKNWKDENKWLTKRGFKTRRDALQWERDFLVQRAGDMNMTFDDFLAIYEKDMRVRLKESTWATKENIIRKKLAPYFGEKPLCEIKASDIVQWQNELLRYRDENSGCGYSAVYLKTVHNQLSAIFNHAVRYYGLGSNPARVAGNMGSEKSVEMKFWTKEEYLKFSEVTMDDPQAYCCFEMLYWCGIREGEVLALTQADFDFETKKVSISKTFQHVNGRDLITEPKTPKSTRQVVMPDFLCEEMQDYLKMCYALEPADRIFPTTKSFLRRKMIAACEQLGIKQIRIHDLRHSHVSLLIHMGFSAVAIAERMGHESINITYQYAHLFPTVQTQMADRLNKKQEDS